MMVFICAWVPALLGCVPLAVRFRSMKARARWALFSVTVASLLLGALALWGKTGETTEIFRLSDSFRFVLRLDGMGKVYLGVAATLWPFATLYAGEYMAHEKREGRFFTWFAAAYTPAILLGTANNLFTLYMAYEWLTLCTVPLVWHARDEASEKAAVRYLLFLIGGASMGFVAMAGLDAFGVGGFDGPVGAVTADNEWFRALCLLGFLGFGVKAAVLPLSRWLPTASVAPTPVTALLHAVAVVNAGVFAVARLLYNALSPDMLRGTWVQAAMTGLAALTVVYAAAAAVREKHIKRRLAWSTVSNLSYMLFGLSLLTAHGMVAGLAHMVFHSAMKIILFLCAGGIIIYSGRTSVRQTHGLGRRMPLLFGCFTLAGVSLLGVPPLPGFVSKYELVTAAFEEGSPLALAGAGALLLAAVLTAVYIFTIVYPAFFMAEDSRLREQDVAKPGPRMTAALAALCVLLIALGAAAGTVVTHLYGLTGGMG